MTARDIPAFQYDCDRGHELAASVELAVCPVVVRGCPCPGTLKRFGRGSGKVRK